MKTFTISLKSMLLVQIACDDSQAAIVAEILESADIVRAFNGVVTGSKYSKALSVHQPDAETDAQIEQKIVETIRIDNERVTKFAGCHYESFVGGPGEYSPPDCFCEKCIAAGRAYRYNSFEVPVSGDMFKYFMHYLACQPGTKIYKWGLAYRPEGIDLSVHNQGCLTIRSNTPRISLGKYVFCHVDKSWGKSGVNYE